MNNSSQDLYNSIYMSIINKGYSGWGGDNRLKLGEEQVQKYLSKEFIPPNGKVLEIGCGEGNLCRILDQFHYEVTGIDISNVAIKWAEEKNVIFNTNIKYICADLSNDSFEIDEKYDIIIDGNCLHCINDDKRKSFLKNLKSLLKIQGVLIISSLCSKDRGDHYINNNGKFYRFVRNSNNLQNELMNNGFTIIDKEIKKYENMEFDHINLYATIDNEKNTRKKKKG